MKEKHTPQGFREVLVLSVLVYQHALLISYTASFELNQMPVFNPRYKNHLLQKVSNVLHCWKKSFHCNGAAVP